MVVAVASAAAVVAVSVVVLVLLAGSPTQQTDSAAPTPSQASTTTAPVPPPSAPTSRPLDGGSSGPTGVSTGPGSPSSREDEGTQRGGGGSASAGSAIFWSVVVDSKRDRSEAEAIARRLSGLGESAQVDWSSDYESLKPGFWVVHVGTYSDERSAYRAQQQLQYDLESAGFADVYRRCFGDMPPCQDNNPRISG